VGLGMALNAKMDKLDYTTYVLMGDGEIAEGSVWEAAELAAYYKINNLVGIVIAIVFGQAGQTMHDHEIKQMSAKFKAFGWNTVAIDGHDVKQIFNAVQKARKTKNMPTMIVAKTYKGYVFLKLKTRLDGMANPLSNEEAEKLIQKMKLRFKKEADYKPKARYVMPLPNSTPLLKPLLKPRQAQGERC